MFWMFFFFFKSPFCLIVVATLTSAVLERGVAIVTQSAALAGRALGVVQAEQTLAAAGVAGVRVQRVDVAVASTGPTLSARLSGVSVVTRGALVAAGTCGRGRRRSGGRNPQEKVPAQLTAGSCVSCCSNNRPASHSCSLALITRLILLKLNARLCPRGSVGGADKEKRHLNAGFVLGTVTSGWIRPPPVIISSPFPPLLLPRLLPFIEFEGKLQRQEVKLLRR